MRWTAALVVLVLGGCAAAPMPAAVEAPQALRMYVNGHPRCACVPVPTGCYTAKHCLNDVPSHAVVTITGDRVTRWTLDPTRDLAHLPYGADPTQRIGTPTIGAPAEWRGMRSGTAVHRREMLDFGPVYRGNVLEVQRQVFDVWCYSRDGVMGGVPQNGGDVIKPGDSGGGFYQNGVLVGILSLYDPSGCGAWTVRVP